MSYFLCEKLITSYHNQRSLLIARGDQIILINSCMALSEFSLNFILKLHTQQLFLHEYMLYLVVLHQYLFDLRVFQFQCSQELPPQHLD